MTTDSTPSPTVLQFALMADGSFRGINEDDGTFTDEPVTLKAIVVESRKRRESGREALKAQRAANKVKRANDRVKRLKARQAKVAADLRKAETAARKAA
jgi:hypothetical protein